MASLQTPQGTLRKRKSRDKSVSPAPENRTPEDSIKENPKGKVAGAASHGENGHKAAFSLITILAFFTRFWGISHPNEVVFDEVHFGKFASYYIQRTYFFDVHPPFAKLLFAFVGWMVGYDGHFKFDNIGDSYIANKVPYVAFRGLPAFLGALTVSVTYLIMWESGYSIPACILAASLVLLDNAHIGQTRLILLDATLVLAMACSLLFYIKFYKLRHEPFSRKWWKWLVLTGFALSCDISTKYVGLFAFITIGSAVVIDLWELLDVKRKGGALAMPEFFKHFMARAFGLIILPFIFYLFWFQVHFVVLSRSGPGDDFMTPEFQETLSDNVMLANAIDIQYQDSLTFRHKETKAYLHSHTEHYPLRYDDGRVSSQGQQVTGYPFNDTNNYWQILPADLNDDGLGRTVRNHDLVRLRHLVTDTILLSHDVASPYYPTNQEFTTVSIADATGERYNDTLFEIRIEHGKDEQEFKSIASYFKLIHNPSKVAMWTHTKPLPEWAFKQQEINGNKAIAPSSNVWFIEDIPSVPEDDPRRIKEERTVKHMPFLKKWLELQSSMFYHNNKLTSSHPYASQPYMWPFLLRGVSFWTHNDTRQQIYFVGNTFGWWLASSLIAVYAGVVLADQLSLRRGIDVLDHRTRSRFYNSTGFFFLAWATHYFPFFLMGRQLFLHHYLPAHLASSLVAGSLLEFVFITESVPETKGKKGKAEPKRHLTASERYAGQSMVGSWIATAVIVILLTACWYFWLPLTYGYPGLDADGIQLRKVLGYDLHFAK